MFAKHLAYHAFEKRSTTLPFDKKKCSAAAVVSEEGEEEEQMLPRFSVGVFRLCRLVTWVVVRSLEECSKR